MTAAAATPPTGKLDPNQLYLGDNGRCHCGALACAGQSAFFNGTALDGWPVVSFAEILEDDPKYPVHTFKCEGCGLKHGEVPRA